MAQRQRAGLITLRTPDRNGSPVFLHFGGFAEATSLLRQTLNTVSLNRGGAEAARRFTLWAHNPEVTGTTPVTGILTLRWLYMALTSGSMTQKRVGMDPG